MQGDKPVAALFRAKIEPQDVMTITKFTTLKEGWMIKSDFDQSLGYVAVKVFPTEASAKASSDGVTPIKVKVEWQL
jgi:hypothetical protein